MEYNNANTIAFISICKYLTKLASNSTHILPNCIWHKLSNFFLLSMHRTLHIQYGYVAHEYNYLTRRIILLPFPDKLLHVIWQSVHQSDQQVWRPPKQIYKQTYWAEERKEAISNFFLLNIQNCYKKPNTLHTSFPTYYIDVVYIFCSIHIQHLHSDAA